MHHTKDLLQKHPHAPKEVDALSSFLNEAFGCAQSNLICADACQSEENVKELGRCIRLNLACGDICLVTAKLVARHALEGALVRAQLEACALACKVCGDECEKHARMHPHCAVCVESCRQTEQACRTLSEKVRAQV